MITLIIIFFIIINIIILFVFIRNIIMDVSATFDGADVNEDVMKFLEVVYGNGWIRVK